MPPPLPKAPTVDQERLAAVERQLAAAELALAAERQRNGAGTVSEITTQKHLQQELQRRERYLTAIATIQQQLLGMSVEVIPGYAAMMTSLREATDASRVYLFEAHTDADGQVWVCQTAESCAPDTVPQIDNPELQRLYLHEIPGLGDRYLNHEIVSALVSELPDPTRQHLQAQNIQAVLGIPLWVKDVFSGFLGFDNCVEARLWDKSEIEFLQSAATAIALNFERVQAETLRRRSEEQLRTLYDQSEELSRRLFEDAPIGITLIDGETGGFLRANREFCRMTGYDSEELKLLTYEQLTHPEDLMGELPLMEQALLRQSPGYQLEKRYIRKNGEAFWAQLTYRLWDFRGAETAVYGLGMVEDISDRKQAESQLKTQQKQLQTLLNNIPHIAWLKDQNNRFLAVNNSFIQACWSTANKIVGQTDFEVWPRELAALYHADDLDVVNSRTSKKIEELMCYGDGSERYVETYKSPILDEFQQVIGTAGIAVDITERRQTEERLRDQAEREMSLRLQLQASLAEKEVLLREVHHRVKNNLQVVSSLLRMQARRSPEASLATLLRESQDRIESMALIHEKLYQSSDLSNIDFGEYVEVLVTQLFHSYGIESQRVRYTIHIQAVDFTLNLAIPCGLIVNELICNCLKYAFPQNRHGTIAITFTTQVQQAETWGYLRVEDDGVGLPTDLDWEMSNSLGLVIVRNLARQLKGIARLDSNPDSNHDSNHDSKVGTHCSTKAGINGDTHGDTHGGTMGGTKVEIAFPLYQNNQIIP